MAGFTWTFVLTGMDPGTGVLSQSGSVTHAHDGGLLKNGLGVPVGGQTISDRLEATARMVPIAENGQLVTAKLAAKLPAAFTKVTVSGAGNSDYDGDWLYEQGANVDFSEGYAVYTLPIKRFKAANTSTLTTKRV